jgi:hypothetical protein
MQLNKTKNLKGLLTTATCALLGTASVNVAQANDIQSNVDEWQFDTALMYYGESDRITAVEGIFAGQKTFANDQVLNLKLTIDALTGSSANGAVAQPNIQTFTRPSGNGSYDINPKDTPLDDTFRDTRLQLTGSWSQPLSENYTWSIAGNASKEYDYLSLAVSSNLARDFNKKNTTVSAGFSYAFDKIEPEGGIPKPFAEMAIGDIETSDFEQAFNSTRIGADDDKTTLDLLLGVTQIISRRMITQFNYSYSKVDGYMSDPFKVLTAVDSNGFAQRYVYENRPDTRTKHAFYGQVKYHFNKAILDTSYRFMTDDWEIDSHTSDTHFYIPLTGGHYIEPHIRLYQQSAAEFYRPFLMNDNTLPTFASADYRIGEMDAYTIGIKYGMPIGSGDSLSFRLEYYKQSPKSDGTPAVGVLKDLELYEEVDAIIAQITYSF